MDLSYSVAPSVRWVRPVPIQLMTEAQTPSVRGSHLCLPTSRPSFLQPRTCQPVLCPGGRITRGRHQSLCLLQAAHVGWRLLSPDTAVSQARVLPSWSPELLMAAAEVQVLHFGEGGGWCGAGCRLEAVSGRLSLPCLPISSRLFTTMCGHHHPHAVPPSSPRGGRPVPHWCSCAPAQPTPQTGWRSQARSWEDVPMGSGQETEEALLYQHFFPRWFLASGAEVLCTHHVPIHPRCHLAATT